MHKSLTASPTLFTSTTAHHLPPVPEAPPLELTGCVTRDGGR